MSLTEALNRFTELGAEWVLWLLLSLSVISIAIIVERAIAFYKRRGDAAELAKLVGTQLAEARIDELKTALKDRRSIEAVVLRAGLAHYDEGPAAAEEAMLAAQVAERQELDRYLVFLGTVGSNAPFIGLAGTVIGIMQAFRNLGGNLQAGASSTVMSAIAEALVATLIGLLVAVPAVISFNYFQRRIKVRINDTQVLVHTLLGHLKAQPAAKAGGAAGSKD
jgi:biopolymer transport protein ExbB